MYAKWDVLQYTVTFNTDGGTDVSSSQIDHGGTVTLPEEPSKPDNRFDGWYTDPSFANRFVFTTPITASMTLYAKWDLVQYTVTFNTDGGTKVTSPQVDHGGTVTLPEEPSKPDNRFDGWYTEASFANRFVFTTPITASMTLYAKWDPLPYNFAFSARSHEVVFTSRNTYTDAVVETSKTAGDVRNIEYTSSDTGIATVDNAGVVTFIKPGTVTITATKEAEGEYGRSAASYELTITKMKPKNKAALSAEIERAKRKHGKTVNLNYIDTSDITDMSRLFRENIFSKQIRFNGDISEWDVSKVTDMSEMFYGAKEFNGDISGWDVSKVTDMSGMFWGAAAFNQDISNWKVGKVTNMNSMFRAAEKFNQDISDWDVSKVTYMRNMFHFAEAFNQDISGWDVSKVTDMAYMFMRAIKFNQNLEKWGKINSYIRSSRPSAQSMFVKSGRQGNRRPNWHKRIHPW